MADVESVLGLGFMVWVYSRSASSCLVEKELGRKPFGDGSVCGCIFLLGGVVLEILILYLHVVLCSLGENPNSGFAGVGDDGVSLEASLWRASSCWLCGALLSSQEV